MPSRPLLVPPKGRLTAFYFYCDAKSEELRQAGRMRVSTNEVMDYWRALSDADRKPWEDQAAKACAAYLEEVMQRAKELEGDEGDDDEDEEPADQGGEDGGAEGADEDAASCILPISRLKKIVRANTEVPTLSKEAVFGVGKATETFLERCVWDAARVTSREKRKTISFRDVVTSMRQHPCPESMQFFVGEPPRMPPPPCLSLLPSMDALVPTACDRLALKQRSSSLNHQRWR